MQCIVVKIIFILIKGQYFFRVVKRFLADRYGMRRSRRAGHRWAERGEQAGAGPMFSVVSSVFAGLHRSVLVKIHPM